MKTEREKIINSLLNSDEFDSVMDKLLLIKSLEMFFDRFEFEEFYYKRNFSLKEYKHYLQPIIKEYLPHRDKQYKKQIKRKEKRKWN